MITRGRSIFENLLQGQTLGFSDEITSAMAAPVVSYYTGMGLVDAYKEGQKLSREKLEQSRQSYPYSSASSELIGSLTSPATYMGSGSIPKATNALSRIGQSSRQGLQIGALYGFGTGEGLQNRMLNATINAGVGAGTGMLGQSAMEAYRNPIVKKSIFDYLADQSGSVKTPVKNYYKNIDKLSSKLTDFLDLNGLEYNFERAGTGSTYLNIYTPNGVETVRISDHSNLSLGSKPSDWQIYPPSDGAVSGGNTVDGLINSFKSRFNLKDVEKIPVKKQGHIDKISRKFSGRGDHLRSILEYSDSFVKDVTGFSKKEISSYLESIK